MQMLDLGMEQLSLIDLAQENDDLLPPFYDYVFPEFSPGNWLSLKAFSGGKIERKDSEAMQMLDLGMEQLSLIDLAQENDDLLPPFYDYVFPEFSPGTMKKNYLRQSLPWDPAFFTEPGILDENELIAYTNMKPKQDLGTSNARKNEVGAHSNSTFVKDKKLKANFLATKRSCGPHASVATPQKPANRTCLPSHKRAPSTSVISLQNPSQVVGKENWHSPLGKNLYSDIRKPSVGPSVLLGKNQKHKRGLSSLSLSSPSTFQDALSSQTPCTFLRKGGGVRYSKKVNPVQNAKQQHKHVGKGQFQLGASSPIMTNTTMTKTAATQPNKDAKKKAFSSTPFAKKFTCAFKTVKNTIEQVLPENKCPRFEDFRMQNNPLFDSPSSANIMLKLGGFDGTQTNDGGFTGGNFSSSLDQQTSGKAQGSENSFLRQSLDWNTAFFTEQGLLDPYELAEYTNTTLLESLPDPSFPKCKTKVMSCHQMQGYTSSLSQERLGKKPLHQMHSTTNFDFIKKPTKIISASTHGGHLLRHQQPKATSQKKTCACPTRKRARHPNDISNKQCNKSHISVSSNPTMTRLGLRFNADIRVEPGDRSRENLNKKVDNLYSKRLASQQSRSMPGPVFNAIVGKKFEKFNPNQPNTNAARDAGSFAQTISSVSRCIKNKLGKVLAVTKAVTKTKNTDNKYQSLIPKDDSTLATPMSGASSSVCHSGNATYGLWPSSNMKSGQVSHALELCTSYTNDSSSIFHSSLSPVSSFGTFSSENSSTCSFSSMTSRLRKGYIDIISSENDHLLPWENLRAKIQCAENLGITSNQVDLVGYDPRSFQMVPFDVKPGTACCKYKLYALKPTRLRLPSPTIGYFFKDNISSLCNTCRQTIIVQYLQTPL